jgi:hypothetical protein
VDARASSAHQRNGDGRETITTAYLPLEANYSTHVPNEKPRPLGGTGASELALLDRRGKGQGATHPTVVSTCAEANRSPCGGQFTNGKRQGVILVESTDRSRHTNKKPRRGVLQGFYRNWCASAFAGWGRMRCNQTHNTLTGSRRWIRKGIDAASSHRDQGGQDR